MLDKRKLAVLFLVPLLVLVFTPVALPAHAVEGHTYTLYVYCDNYSSGEYDTIKLTFAGHTVTTTCFSIEDFENWQGVTFFSSLSGLYHVSSTTGTTTHSGLGWFSPSSCYVEGETWSPTFGSYVYWYVQSDHCEFEGPG